tara:strand:- start:109 stop:285 length:177 start_codon:yes stop_codon:yes gene_type:complete
METEFTVSKFDKEYYRNRYVAAINKIATMTGTIVDLQQQLITLTEKSQLDNTGNKDNE